MSRYALRTAIRTEKPGFNWNSFNGLLNRLASAVWIMCWIQKRGQNQTNFYYSITDKGVAALLKFWREKYLGAEPGVGGKMEQVITWEAKKQTTIEELQKTVQELRRSEFDPQTGQELEYVSLLRFDYNQFAKFKDSKLAMIWHKPVGGYLPMIDRHMQG